MSDLVGVVIPAYIGALSSLASVVVAIVALVTARQAKADARTAAEAGARTAERERQTREAAGELASLVRDGLDTPAKTADPEQATGSLGRMPASPPRSSSAGRRPHAPRENDGRRPHWSARTDGSPTLPAGRPTVQAPVTVDDTRRRLDDLVRRLADD